MRRNRLHRALGIVEVNPQIPAGELLPGAKNDAAVTTTCAKIKKDKSSRRIFCAP